VHDVDNALRWLAEFVREGSPATGSVPNLREDHRRLVEARPVTPSVHGHDLALVLLETDLITNSIDTLIDLLRRSVNESSNAGINR
jgi:hypothetical protein